MQINILSAPFKKSEKFVHVLKHPVNLALLTILVVNLKRIPIGRNSVLPVLVEGGIFPRRIDFNLQCLR